MEPGRRDRASPISAVFGTDARMLDDAFDVQSRALALHRASWNLDASSCATWAAYGDGGDAITRAIEQRHELSYYADLWHLFVDAVIAAVPHHHEVFLVEVAPPHRLWFVDNGSCGLASPGLFDTEQPSRPVDRPIAAAGDPFTIRASRAAWLFGLLLGVDGSGAYGRRTIRELWHTDGAPHGPELLARWKASQRSCGDTLGALWAAYFAGGPIDALREIGSEHPAGAVRSSVALIDALDAGTPGVMYDRIRKRRGWLRSAS